MRVLKVQNIGVIFGTAAVIQGLADRMSENKCLNVKGIHLGGMSSSAEFMDMLSDKFPNAVVLSGYGNTLFGMMPQLHYDQKNGFDYYPFDDRLVAQVIQYDEDNDKPCLGRLVDYGQRGQVMVHRLDEIQFIANMTERDTAIRISPTKDIVNDGFALDGIRDPMPIVSEKIKPVIGLY
jgi:hypothetical protein